ncbi:hypothetical protein CRG98_018620 [Punica granatum]|uniref:Uncharacterized protein n=1 Tax=Punica granatum TaxID=22663 RepID=A0A2I0JYU0_PUNGR|nr:hypothetical protein CRG98_018620 [Punica granatum]
MDGTVHSLNKFFCSFGQILWAELLAREGRECGDQERPVTKCQMATSDGGAQRPVGLTWASHVRGHDPRLIRKRISSHLLSTNRHPPPTWAFGPRIPEIFHSRM